MNALAKAVFVDKDGTIIEDLPYNVDTRKIRFMPGVAEGLPLLCAAGYKIVVVTNQSGIARGFFSEKDMERVREHLRDMFHGIGVPLEAFYFCPHLPGGVMPGYGIACSCRKPEPGLIVRAAREHRIDVSRSWLIGDILNDVEAGRRAGCRTVLINTGKETEWVLSMQRLPHHIVSDFAQAANVIVSFDRVRDLPDRRRPEPCRIGGQP